MKHIEKKYFVLNKPKGYVCALKDNLHPCVMDLIDEDVKGLHIVGRLDKDTTGIIVITNDGQYTHNATHPKKHVKKTYKVKSLYPLSQEDINQIEDGMYIDHGVTKLKNAQISIVGDFYLLTITEGKFHQIKKMFFALKNEVIELDRIIFDGIDLRKLNIKQGEYVEYKFT